MVKAKKGLVYLELSLPLFGEETIFLNACSKALSSLASTFLAVSMNRFDCFASSGYGLDLRAIIPICLPGVILLYSRRT